MTRALRHLVPCLALAGVACVGDLGGSAADPSGQGGVDAAPGSGGDGGGVGPDGAIAACPSDPAYAGPEIVDVPRGAVFGRHACGPGVGFAVTDARDGAGRPARLHTFWRLLGGVDGAGWPRSARFVGADGRVRQLFDAGVAVVDPATGRVTFDDVLARTSADEDARLLAAGVPAPSPAVPAASPAFGPGIEAVWRLGPDNPLWCPFTEADARALFGAPVSAWDATLGAQRLERVAVGADGRPIAIGAALAAAAPRTSPADATHVPAAALVGERMPAPEDALAPLAARLAPLVAAHAGDVSVAVIDLETGARVELGVTRPHTAASTLKWWMIEAALAALDGGDAGFAMADLDGPARLILRDSSNTDASTVVRLVGGDAINRHMMWAGMTESALVGWSPYTSACYDDPPEDAAFNWNNHLTAGDAARALEAFWRGETVSAASRTWLLETAEALTPTWYLATDLPPGRGIRWAHKVGFIPPDAYTPADEALNDVGIVTVPDRGYAFAIAVLTSLNADHDGTAGFIAEVTGVVVEELDLVHATP